jgi:CRISPR type I-E-associated protein CasB/Cse2
MNTTLEEKETDNKFTKRLASLSSGELAILRRCNQNPLEDPRLFSTLGKLGILNSYDHSLVACLYAVYHRPEDIPLELEKYNFGQTFRDAYDPIPTEKEKLSKYKSKNDVRFRAILSADKGDALAYRLRQAVRLIRSKNEPIDFDELLKHLLNWEHPSKWVQREWAKGYYQGFIDQPVSKDTEESEIESEEDED